ncbi:hypothetical protein AHAS_Ahas05G0080300 [Arachis hypogaea]
MPLFVMKKLQIKEAQPTRIVLQMADESLKHAHEIVENLLVKVEKFFLPADFIILDIGEDDNASIILGRPFLTTERALIDVEEGELVLRVHEEKLVFYVLKIMHSSGEEERCMQIDLIDPNLQESPDDTQQHSLQPKHPLVKINKIFTDIKSKFGVGNAMSRKEEAPKKKVSKG